jgi:hypothetical protein
MKNTEGQIQKPNVDFFPNPEGFTNKWNYQ